MEPPFAYFDGTSVPVGFAESLSGETIEVVGAQTLLHVCTRASGDPRPCVVERFRALLEAHPDRAMRFVLPTNPESFGGRRIELTPFLHEAADQLGRGVATERSFATPAGLTTLLLERVAPR